MSVDPYIGEIIIFAGDYAMQNYAQCTGTLIDLAQHQALFSIVGTTYGGDGRSTFGVPDLRGRAPVQFGNNHYSTSNVPLGGAYGEERETLSVKQMPPHSHGVQYSGSSSGSPNLTIKNSKADQTDPGNNSYLAGWFEQNLTKYPMYTDSTGNEQEINGVAGGGFYPDKLEIENTGMGDSINVAGPRLGLNFLIALQGTYPPRP